MKYFKFFLKASFYTVFLVILAGSVVRMTGSGMGCPDWPKCFGYYIPPTDVSELFWKPSENYKKGMIIIIDETLFEAKESFISEQKIDLSNWKKYTKHDYAIFNPLHTWVEYINRLVSVLLGIFMLGMLVFSFFQKKKIFILLTILNIVLVGFQAWLGKTVVDSVLLPYKVTIHLLVAFLIVALFGYMIFLSKDRVYFKLNGVLKWTIMGLIILIIQVVLGTQTREFIDHNIQKYGYENKHLWLEFPEIVFYIHRSFSFLVIGIYLYLFWFLKKKYIRIKRLNIILVIIGFEVFLGVLMNYFEFPFLSQPLHLLLSTILFYHSFLLVLESYGRIPLENKLA